MKKLKAIGIDFGATFNKMGLVDESGVMLDRADFATADAASLDQWLARVDAGIRRFERSGHCICGMGVGVPGFVDFERGFIHQITNVKGWRNVPLARKLRDRFGMPALVDNDANAMALGECTHGAGRTHDNAVFVTLGTGVGGAIYIGGQLYRGSHSMAGELGHVSIKMDGHATPEGRGGLETYVGIRSITRRATNAIRAGRSSLILSLAGGDARNITPRLIAQAARRKDALALEIFDHVADCLAAAFASVTYLLQPEVFIVGGGVAQSGTVLFKPLRRHLKERLNPIFGKLVSVKRAAMGNRAGMIGCAQLVFDQTRSRRSTRAKNLSSSAL